MSIHDTTPYMLLSRRERLMSTILDCRYLTPNAKIFGAKLALLLPDDSEEDERFYVKVDVGSLEKQAGLSRGRFSASFPYLYACGFYIRETKYRKNDAGELRRETHVAHGSRIIQHGLLDDLRNKPENVLTMRS